MREEREERRDIVEKEMTVVLRKETIDEEEEYEYR